jgi:phage baseplate assembly protein W
MAYNVRKIDPLDLQARKAIGIDIPFAGQAVFNSTYQSADAIRANLINYFLTGKGERRLNPSFGAGLQNIVFQNITNNLVGTLRERILDDLEIYFPRVVVEDLRLEGTPSTNTVIFSMSYSISNTNISDEVVINFEQ